jgi:CheY-like chemotaxis protein
MKRTEHTGEIKRILLVDDNKSGAPARKSALAEHGFEVSTASSGHEALEIFQQTPFDLVVTDYRMPKMNGVQLIAALRELCPALPVVILSGFAETGGLTEASTGANIVLQKGANECQHLLRAVNRLLFQRATRKPASSATGRKASAASAASKRK